MKWFSLTIAAVLLLPALSDAQSGLAAVRATEPRTGAASKTGLHVTDARMALTVHGGLAHTEVLLTLSVEEENRMEAGMEFSLPPETSLTGAALDIEGRMRAASITEPRKAINAYESVVRRMLDPCLVLMRPDGKVSIQVFPVSKATPRQVGLTFEQVLVPENGKLRWNPPLLVPGVKITVTSERSEIVLPEGGQALEFPLPESGRITAHSPGDNKPRAFHAVIPMPPPVSDIKAPRVLFAADISAPMAARDAASECSALETLLRSSGVKEVTLITFSTCLHSREILSLPDGNCAALRERLSAAWCEGAACPGVLDLSGEAADLVILSSNLSAPMGTGPTPALPPGARVLVLDSVSEAISNEAEIAAANLGGKIVDLRRLRNFPDSLRAARSSPPVTVTAGEVTNLHCRVLPGEEWLELSGLMESESAQIRLGSAETISVTKGDDQEAGSYAAAHVARRAFCVLAAQGAAAATLSEHARSAPVLSPWTSFIVLEQKAQYQTFGIELPPDLASPDDPRPVDRGLDRRREMQWLIDTLNTPQADEAVEPGTHGSWHGWGEPEPPVKDLPSLMRDPKFAERLAEIAGNLDFDRERLLRLFQADADASALENDLRSALTAGTGIPEVLGRALAREIESVECLREAEIRDERSSGADPFAGGAGIGFGSAARRSFADADPFAGPQRSESPREVSPVSISGTIAAEKTTAIAPVAVPTDPLLTEWSAIRAAAGHEEIVLTARKFRDAGRNAEALRILSVLALTADTKERPQANFTALGLLAWILEEWGEQTLADAVNTGIERRFGPQCRPLLCEPDTLPVLTGVLAVTAERLDFRSNLELEVIGPDFEMASPLNPRPEFGGVILSGTGISPDEFLLPEAKPSEYGVRVRIKPSESSAAQPTTPVRVRIWKRGSPVRTFIFPACGEGRTAVDKITLP